MLEYVIDGHDGAAKTPIIERVTRALEQQQLRVHSTAIFHSAGARVPEGDLYPMWADDERASLAVGLLQLEVERARQEAKAAHADALLFDRHWMTVMVETVFRPMEGLWTDFLPTFFIEAPPSKTMACNRFSHKIPWTSTNRQVFDYYARYLAIAKLFPQHILSTHVVRNKRDDLSPMVAQITAHILSTHARS